MQDLNSGKYCDQTEISEYFVTRNPWFSGVKSFNYVTGWPITNLSLIVASYGEVQNENPS